jgi:hypothetical protein
LPRCWTCASAARTPGEARGDDGGGLGAAAAVTALWAGYLVVAPRPADPPRRLTDGSPAPPLIAAGLLLTANGLAFGLWLVLIGAEVTAFGLGLLLAERRASRAR